MSNPRKRWLLLAVAILDWSRPALGQSSAVCRGPEIVVSVPPTDRDRWSTLRADLSEHLLTVRDLDRCARLTVREQGDAMFVDVRTGDDRAASRTVYTKAQLLRASEALLTLPPRAENSAPVIPAGSPTGDPLEPHESHVQAPGSRASVELGVAAAARLSGAPLFIAGGVAGAADAAVHPWLVGVAARWEMTGGLLNEPTLMDYYLMSTAIGVHVGRRFELSNTSLDVLLGPNLVFEMQDADDGQLDIGGSAADVRIGLGARLSGPRRARMRAFGSADLELSPARLVKARYVDPSLPALPSFSFGLALGVLWSSQ